MKPSNQKVLAFRTERIASVFMQIYRVYLKLLHACCSWQKEVKKEYYFGPVLLSVEYRVCEHQGDVGHIVLAYQRRSAGKQARCQASLSFPTFLFISHQIKVTLLPLMIFFFQFIPMTNFLHPLLLLGQALCYFTSSLSHSLPI